MTVTWGFLFLSKNIFFNKCKFSALRTSLLEIKCLVTLPMCKEVRFTPQAPNGLLQFRENHWSTFYSPSKTFRELLAHSASPTKTVFQIPALKYFIDVKKRGGVLPTPHTIVYSQTSLENGTLKKKKATGLSVPLCPDFNMLVAKPQKQTMRLSHSKTLPEARQKSGVLASKCGSLLIFFLKL